MDAVVTGADKAPLRDAILPARCSPVTGTAENTGNIIMSPPMPPETSALALR
jgi:hypothetical protein